MKKLLALGTLSAFATHVLAHIDTFYRIYQPPDVNDAYVPDFNDGNYWTVDLLVQARHNDDWTSTYGVAALDKGVFFEHPLGDDTPSLAILVDRHPALEYDSFYAATESDLGNRPPYKDPRFVDPIINEPSYRETIWFERPPNGGVAEALIARYTVKIAPEQLPATLDLMGTHTTTNHECLFPYTFAVTIPEPAALALFALGAVLVRRR